ncbi:stage II sporulation protein E [Amphibacillus marinus]|uniref:Stage II sporulation protein E n=1 Tax=Amphibacillus marinus TaxID=872970 RepID=A0A1H8TKS7_9BACI|nr:stage II sporulation protein E [Amphibacillus marinus]SEO91455.1 stage II sporulation protein E [Amphibacillus marinus]
MGIITEAYSEKLKYQFKVRWIKTFFQVMKQQDVALYVISFLLGRAVIMDELIPFSLAYFASVWVIKRERAKLVLLFSIFGVVTVGFSPLIILLISYLCFGFFISLGLFVNSNRHLPYILALSSMLGRLAFTSLSNQFSNYALIMAFTEALLAGILFLIFIQSTPLVAPKRYKPVLKNEELISCIILVASVLCGLSGMYLVGVNLEDVFSRYLILMLALIGGPTIGATVGVILGLILSLVNETTLTQLSLLAFSGLLGGLMREGGKFAISSGLIIGTFLLSIYVDGTASLFPSVVASITAILLFLLTPTSLTKRLARFIPGSNEQYEEQQQYLQKLRDATANRMEQFSDVFEALSKTFTGKLAQEIDIHQEERELDDFLSHVTEQTCQGCFKKTVCWAENFDSTYQNMAKIKQELSQNGHVSQITESKFKRQCMKANKVEAAIKDQLSYYKANQHLKKQVGESRRFVADQLLGVSEVMDNFAREIVHEREHHDLQEQQIVNALTSIGMEIEQLDIYSLRKGEIDIEMTLSVYQYHDEGNKVIAPILSDILKENVVVAEEEISPMPNGYCFLIFKSARAFQLDIGVAHAAQGGGFISGDSYSTMELAAGKYALAISDGMGNGKRAREESMQTLHLLQQILQSGIDEQVAIKSINSILSLRMTDEIFSTLDLAMVDLQSANVQFLKIGSTPSFIKRGHTILPVESSNLPIGIVKEFDVEVVDRQLEHGDILIMTSDGIFEAPKLIENQDIWLKRVIKQIETSDPQEIADLLLEEVVRLSSGKIEDDMTILVAKVQRYQSKWATVPYYKVSE